MIGRFWCFDLICVGSG